MSSSMGDGPHDNPLTTQMPSYHDIPQGDMYIEYAVVFPTEVSDSSRQSEWRFRLDRTAIPSAAAHHSHSITLTS